MLGKVYLSMVIYVLLQLPKVESGVGQMKLHIFRHIIEQSFLGLI